MNLAFELSVRIAQWLSLRLVTLSYRVRSCVDQQLAPVPHSVFATLNL